MIMSSQNVCDVLRSDRCYVRVCVCVSVCVCVCVYEGKLEDLQIQARENRIWMASDVR